MSSPSSLVFFGVRFTIIDGEEIERLEYRSHRLFEDARRSGLRCYWGNFAEPDEKHFAFLGKVIAILGFENSQEESMSEDELRTLMIEVRVKLSQLGYEEAPKLYLHWMPDA